MRPGVHLYGGFAGDETVRTQRDLEANPTRIDGSRAREGEAAYHVVAAASFATLDGFTITGGNANGLGLFDDMGGGMFIMDCAPVIMNCTFLGNEAKSDGGAISIWDGSAEIIHCTFTDNRTLNHGGGALSISKGEATIRRSTFIRNVAASYGSAIEASGNFIDIENCLFVENECLEDQGTLIYGDEFSMNNCTVVGSGKANESLSSSALEDASIINTIIWNMDQDFSKTDATIRHSILPGGAPGEGNLDLDPLFVDPENGDYRLQPNSPAIDAGTLDGAPQNDLDGTPRPQGAGIDMGAFEG